MKRLTFFLAATCLLSFTFSQTTLNLTLTAIDEADYAQLDSIKVMNRTQGGDTVLYYPDTVLSLVMTGINEIISKESGFHLFQNYPNPVNNQSTVSIQIPSSGMVNTTITDLLGRVVVHTDQDLEKGTYSFSFTPGDGELYFLTAKYKNESQSIKMLCSPIVSGNKVSLEFIGRTNVEAKLKASMDIQNFLFNYGDELLFIGYYDTHQSGILDSPDQDKTYTYQFAYNIPCPGTPTVEYEGHVYNTVQIFCQCWLKENLNVGTMIQGVYEMTDNGILEKYCYDNEQDSCAKYGGLYQWDEMMQYSTQQGTQGICPPGWHLPADEEWKVLEGAVDSQYGIGDPEWDEWGLRGSDAGSNLKTTNGWYDDGNGTDLFGFSGLPGGGRNHLSGYFYGIGRSGNAWSSTEGSFVSHAWGRYLGYDYPEVDYYGSYKEYGFNIRCLKDQ